MASPRLQTAESWTDQIDRLRSMIDPRQEKWDLSPNDVAAITAALARLDAVARLSFQWREYEQIAESRNRAEQWKRCADALDDAMGGPDGKA